eukprot:TRINITY_DN5184_c0_g1_i3.p1 TRINITY_DN5184_c0_g1~~TRINITY_DN5184_c0_g1_i3.p1  ORF type:complete len:151 (+),score=8.92 TRINITY_DN5184_c0_g1_i3:37-453(+)
MDSSSSLLTRNGQSAGSTDATETPTLFQLYGRLLAKDYNSYLLFDRDECLKETASADEQQKHILGFDKLVLESPELGALAAELCPRVMDPIRFVSITNYYLERVGIDVGTLEPAIAQGKWIDCQRVCVVACQCSLVCT